MHDFIRGASPGPALVARDNREPAPLGQRTRSFVFNRQLRSLEQRFTFVLVRPGQRREEPNLDFGALQIMVGISPRARIIHCVSWNDRVRLGRSLCETMQG